MDISAERLTMESFAAFGDVLEAGGNGSERLTNMDFLGRGLIMFPEGHETDDPSVLDAFDYWPAITALPDDAKAGMLSARPRPMEIRYFERHVLGKQLMINLGPVPVVLVVAPGQTDHEPPESALTSAWRHARAFVLEVGEGVNLLPSVWHWPPFPVGDVRARCFMVVRASAGRDDYTFSSVEAVGGEVLRVHIESQESS